MSAPKPPCKGCSLHQMGCKTDCARWAIYERDFKAWKKTVNAEKNRYLGILDAEIQRKAKEKKRSGREK